MPCGENLCGFDSHSPHSFTVRTLDLDARASSGSSAARLPAKGVKWTPPVRLSDSGQGKAGGDRVPTQPSVPSSRGQDTGFSFRRHGFESRWDCSFGQPDQLDVPPPVILPKSGKVAAHAERPRQQQTGCTVGRRLDPTGRTGVYFDEASSSGKTTGFGPVTAGSNPAASILPFGVG